MSSGEIGDQDVYDIQFVTLSEPDPKPSVNEQALATTGLSRASERLERSPVKVKDYVKFAKKHFGEFLDVSLLITAFTHRSYLNENRGAGIATEHNERLEFLGDAVLELVVTEYLYRNFTEPEGKLTDWRTSLVRTESIAAAAEREGFESLLRLSRGEKRTSSERARRQILANCFEAVLGAAYLAKGQEAAREFIERTLLPTLNEILENGSWIDPKSRLQEIAQGNIGAVPEYRLMSEDGPDHDKTFVIGVFIDGQIRGRGVGASKQDAQTEAATNALKGFRHSLTRQSPGARRPPGRAKF